MAREIVIPKEVYKKQCEERLEKKRQEIKKLNRKLKTLVSGSVEYKKCKSDIERTKKRAKDCVQSIYMMDVQMNLHTYRAFAGLPLIFTFQDNKTKEE